MRKRREPFDLFRDMDEMFDEMMREFESGDIREGGPFIYGFTWNKRGEGEPEIREFGNVQPGRGALEIGERKPLIDVFDTDDTVHVVAEMPGIEKEDVELSIDGRTLDIRAARGDRRYNENVELPTEVDDKSAKATYKNGVLDIVMKKAKDSKKRKKINVE